MLFGWFCQRCLNNGQEISRPGAGHVACECRTTARWLGGDCVRCNLFTPRPDRWFCFPSSLLVRPLAALEKCGRFSRAHLWDRFHGERPLPFPWSSAFEECSNPLPPDLGHFAVGQRPTNLAPKPSAPHCPPPNSLANVLTCQGGPPAGWGLFFGRIGSPRPVSGQNSIWQLRPHDW